MRAGGLIAVLLIASALPGCDGASSLDPQPAEPLRHYPTYPGWWLLALDLPTARQETPSALLGGYIYTPGGFDASGNTSSVVEVFDLTAGVWSVGPRMPAGLHHSGVAAAGGVLYVVGGYSPGPSFATFGPAGPWVYALDPREGTWRERAPLPKPRAALGVVAYGDRIYAFGGVGPDGAPSKEALVYDPKADRWSSLDPMPTAREQLAAAVIGDRIYVVGGRASAALSALEVYDPASNSWKVLPNMPTPRAGLAAAALDGKLYVFGGEVPFVFPNTEEFDPQTSAWRRVADLPTPRHGLGAVTVGDGIHVIGGGIRLGVSASRAHEVFHP